MGPVARSRSSRPPGGHAPMAAARMPSRWLTCSTLMTSAPMAAKYRPAPALASIQLRSTIRMSDSANGLPCLLTNGAWLARSETWTRAAAAAAA